jgi:hypothetical protein
MKYRRPRSSYANHKSEVARARGVLFNLYTTSLSVPYLYQQLPNNNNNTTCAIRITSHHDRCV